jgi:hypothetical protein
MAQPWHDDPEELSTDGVYIIYEDLADTLDDFGQAHYLDPDKTYSRPSYAAKAGLKVIGPNYLLLVRIEMQHDRIGWMIMLTSNDVHDMFGEDIIDYE